MNMESSWITIFGLEYCTSSRSQEKMAGRSSILDGCLCCDAADEAWVLKSSNRRDPGSLYGAGINCELNFTLS